LNILLLLAAVVVRLAQTKLSVVVAAVQVDTEQQQVLALEHHLP
jgi:hypothetical protein